MHITLIRHLPTKWNQSNMLQGRQDIEITEISEDLQNKIESNKLLLNAFAPFDIVLASTLKRTHQTAKAYGYVPETEGLLDELDFGRFEGVSKERLIAAYDGKWIEDPRELILGESLIDFEKRVIAFLEKYSDYTNLLVFGHGSWIRAIVSYHHYGDINKMNKMIIENNQCITLRF
ncbi:phosphoglycerate mutase family protein [Bacillus sp. DNRA2]|uniref:histidine phosphatase family protein n=1 Tax=Bacillus sp. DNRA2 TaxID=2723053 RepID=UPI00145F9B4B|nr:phosphoglycerate mutase family protein [Bacillus sp. DNRA2]NMD72573.1 phosphoglycerate mutase family protein [Bacillus sp. DNRA2]